MKYPKFSMACALFASSLLSAVVSAQPPVTVEALWDIVQRQQQQISDLENRLTAYDRQLAATETTLESTGQALDATADVIETLQANAAAPTRTTLGGYGELHYNNLDAVDPARNLNEIDFHRFVLFLGHRFNDRVSFFSELEVEHSLAGDGAPGEVELEQAFVRFDINDRLAAQTGLFLLPVGILNETHEPPTFYGVERNDVENIILPSTWWEAGGGLSGNSSSGLSWDLAVHSGLAIPTTGSNAFRVRSGRQKVAEALASDFALTGRLRYTGIPGLELAASLQHQSDPSQIAGDGLDSGRLVSAHAIYRKGGFGLRALYARWDFDGFAVDASGRDVQTGAYLEPSFRFGGPTGRWGVYGRIEDVEGARDQDLFSQREIGFNYWPTSDVILKFTFRDREHDLPGMSERDFDGFDLGVGYQF